MLTLTLRLWRADFSIPFANSGDALWCQSWIKGIQENGWYLTNPRLGAPGAMDLYDFPQADNLHFLLLKALVSATHDVSFTFNVYYLLGFPLIALSTLFVLRRFGTSRLAALSGSLWFSFLPYHFVHGQHHLFLASYFVLPLAVMMILWVYTDRLRWPWSRRDPQMPWGRGRMWGSLLVALLVASSGVYYAFFTCYLLLVAGLASVLDRKKWQGMLMAGTLVGVTTAAVVVNLVPCLIYQYQHGPNPALPGRTVDEAEHFGLKIGQLLLPIDEHVIGRLNPLRQRYDLSPLASGEKVGATLGAVGTAGFLFLIGLLFCRTRTRQGEVVPGLAALNIAAVLLATVGGFGSLFALLVSAQIRCYNRMSLFIALLSLFAVAILLDRLADWFHGKGYRIWQYRLALACLAAFGLVDEIGRSRAPDYAALKAQFECDRDFVREVEQQLPADAMLLQLPYFPFPETPPLHQLGDYDLVRLYLHASALKFSYAAMRGGAADRWQKEVSALPIEEQLPHFIEQGFAGIAIDRAGYDDRGAELENDLRAILNQEPLVSRDERLAYYALPAADSMSR
ncbi:MAG TPA: hypothetical protein VNH11_23820 [Pirellulales bacterium]|nr:hypothetical protein [Pirellulales bacterium]